MIPPNQQSWFAVWPHTCWIVQQENFFLFLCLSVSLPSIYVCIYNVNKWTPTVMRFNLSWSESYEVYSGSHIIKLKLQLFDISQRFLLYNSRCDCLFIVRLYLFIIFFLSTLFSWKSILPSLVVLVLYFSLWKIKNDVCLAKKKNNRQET